MPENYPEGSEADVNGATYVRQGGQWVLKGQQAPQASPDVIYSRPKPELQPRPAPPELSRAYDTTGIVQPSGAFARAPQAAPPSAADVLAREQKEERAAAAAEARREKAQRLYNKADEALNQIDAADTRFGWGTEGQPGSFGIGPWINTATGLIGQNTEGLGGTPAFDLSGTFDTMGSILGLNEIQDMKANSPNGSGLGGNTSDRDMQLVMSSVASLKPGQSREQNERNLRQIQQHAAGMGAAPRQPRMRDTASDAEIRQWQRTLGKSDAEVARYLGRPWPPRELPVQQTMRDNQARFDELARRRPAPRQKPAPPRPQGVPANARWDPQTRRWKL